MPNNTKKNCTDQLYQFHFPGQDNPTDPVTRGL